MKPKRLLIVGIAALIGIFTVCLFLVFLFFSFSGNKNAPGDITPSNTAQGERYYELPRLIPSAWYVGR